MVCLVRQLSGSSLKCAAVAIAVFGASPAEAQLERLVGNDGQTIGYLQKQGEKTFVKDRCQQTLGYVTEKGTYTDTGVRKAQSPLPYMLLESPRNCAKRKDR